MALALAISHAESSVPNPAEAQPLCPTLLSLKTSNVAPSAGKTLPPLFVPILSRLRRQVGMRWLVTLHLQAGSERQMLVLNLLCLFHLSAPPPGRGPVLPIFRVGLLTSGNPV